jgi:CubicO group peptidase (beta-lactamase class C family)
MSTAGLLKPRLERMHFFDDRANSAWSSEPAGESGAGGLVSTLDDYFVFSRMLLNQGRHGHDQILSRAAVELMTSDHLTPEHRLGAASVQPPTPILRRE